ncbi:class II aldolase/adducin family protein [candidate division KSB3 bacterium]|uniref:Class II aldolase/adducin family protein n=1 Tax=candidate division KSB3 bacterium TaxID=2044937 RepID=A0A9D5JWS6_9BACT|nr:class II aldolase/adducin family protein [candidate division KSB3 bacterium]MBD3325342.1 class II aldolase/adducin family protein [candidate division KSB3 bacterium]
MTTHYTIDALKREIIEIGRQAMLHGYVTTVGGNISVRLNEREFLVTATGVPLDELNDENVILIDQDGNTQSRFKPSKEAPMHLLIYEARPEIQAVVHLHPIIATTLASLDIPITPVTFEQVFFLGDEIGIVAPLSAGGEDLHRAVLAEAIRCNTVILKHHGCVAVGTTLKEAYFRAVKIERAAHATLIARTFGKTIEPPVLL